MKKELILLLSSLLLSSCGPNHLTSESNSSSNTTTTESIEHLYSVDVPTIAHRGYAINEVENTAGAFIEAGKRNFIGIETDIYFTKDNWIVCNHDNKIRGMNKNIDQCTLDEIMEVDLSLKGDKEIHVCTFNEYLQICAEYNKIPVIEFKTTPAENRIEFVIDLIKQEYGNINNVMFISFGRLILQRIQKFAKLNDYKYDIYRLTQSDSAIDEAIEDNMNISHQWDILTDEQIKKVKDANLKVAVWTCNDEKAVPNLIERGIEIITTDYIECDPKYC